MASMANCNTISIGAHLPVRPVNPLRQHVYSAQHDHINRSARIIRASIATPQTTVATEKTAYTLAAALSGGVSLNILLAQTNLISALNMPSMGAITLLKQSTAGAIMFVSAIAAYRCLLAASNGRLNSETYQRLTLVSTLANVAPLLAYISSGLTLNALSTVGRVLLTSRFAVGAILLGVWSKTSTRPTALLKDLADNFGDLLTVPSSLTSAFYSAWSLAATVGSVYILREAQAVAVDTSVNRLLGAYGFVAAGVLYSLKSAADRNRLNGTTFKQLNLAVGGAFAVLGGLVYSATNAGTLAASNTTTGAVGALAVSAVVALYLGVTGGGEDSSSSGGGSVAATKAGYEYKQSVDPLESFCANDPSADECRVFDD